jgi:hypothetical protein
MATGDSLVAAEPVHVTPDSQDDRQFAIRQPQ